MTDDPGGTNNRKHSAAPVNNNTVIIIVVIIIVTVIIISFHGCSCACACGAAECSVAGAATLCVHKGWVCMAVWGYGRFAGPWGAAAAGCSRALCFSLCSFLSMWVCMGQLSALLQTAKRGGWSG